MIRIQSALRITKFINGTTSLRGIIEISSLSSQIFQNKNLKFNQIICIVN